MIKSLKILLAPLVLLYGLIISLRNLFFDKSVFKSEKVNANVISVGNINVGGSGKTPLVIYVTNLLKNTGYKVGVLSRGYGRRSIGYKLVSKGAEILTSVEECGDEIYHTALECRVAAAVCENRVKGAKRLIEETGIDSIVLDDAFQHRWIARDVDLVVVDQSFVNNKSFFTHNLLPAGDLREGFDSLKRADAIILNRKFLDKEEIKSEMRNHFDEKKIFTSHYLSLIHISEPTRPY